MKKLFLTTVFLGLAYVAGAVDITLLDPAVPAWKKTVSVTNRLFSITVSKDEPGVLILEAKITEKSPVITRKEWHGFDLIFPEPIPSGKVTFEFKPETMTTMWLSVMGKAPDGSKKKLDKPVNMYGSNIAKPGVWNKVEIDTTKAHIVGGKGFGSLESFSRLELRLHPDKYTKPGTYRCKIRNIRCKLAE